MARANGSTSGANGAAGRSRAVLGPAKFMGSSAARIVTGSLPAVQVRGSCYISLYIGPDLHIWEIEIAAAADSRPWPTELRLAKDRRSLTVGFASGASYVLEGA